MLFTVRLVDQFCVARFWIAHPFFIQRKKEAYAMLFFFFFFFLLVTVVLSFTYVLNALQPENKLPPGPRGLPVVGHLHMLGDLPHRNLYKLSQKYGPIVQLKLGLVPAIVVSTPEVAEIILKTHDITFASRPRTQASHYIAYGSKGVGFAEYGPYWRKIRKLCSIHLLSNSKIDSFGNLRKEEARVLVKNLKEAAKGGELVNITSKIGSAIERTIYRMICGSSGESHMFNLKKSVENAMRLAGAFNIADFVPFMQAFDIQGLTHQMKSVSKILDTFLEKIILEHEEDTTPKKDHQRDFIHVMLSIMNSDDANEEPLDRNSIKAIILDMLAASMDTSATTVEWALTELLRHPEAMKQVQEELATVVGLDRMVEENDLSKLAYLNNVVKETLRLHPAAPLLVPRESTKDISVLGYHIPKKSRIIINAWAIGRDPNAWPDQTEEFFPARFNSIHRDVRGNDIQLIPFGSGRRKCPGIELGIRTVHLLLAQLVHCFDMELPDGMLPNDIDVKEKFGLTVHKANPLLVVPSYRLNNESL